MVPWAMQMEWRRVTSEAPANLEPELAKLVFAGLVCLGRDELTVSVDLGVEVYVGAVATRSALVAVPLRQSGEGAGARDEEDIMAVRITMMSDVSRCVLCNSAL